MCNCTSENYEIPRCAIAHLRSGPSDHLRAIMLKGASLHNLEYDTIALFALMLPAMTIAVTRFRRTLD
jgi:hypothetical protein